MTETVFIVDDDPSVLRAVGRLVRSAGMVAAGYPSPREFLADLRRGSLGDGCLVLDLSMPELGGLEVQRELGACAGRLPIVFLTGNGDIPTGVRAMKAGAVDFLTKPCSDDQLLAAIGEALERGRAARADEAAAGALRARFSALTPRESEVMRGVVAGKLNKQIADELGAAEKTIKVHRARVMRKVGVESVAELARLADRAGLA